MSIIIATFENGSLVSGRADDFFRYHNHEATEVASTGHVDSPVGYVTLRKFERDDIAKYASEHGDPWITATRNFPPGWYIDGRGEDGAVWAFHYACPEDDHSECGYAEFAARKDFAEAVRVYGDWIEDPDDLENAEPARVIPFDQVRNLVTEIGTVAHEMLVDLFADVDSEHGSVTDQDLNLAENSGYWNQVLTLAGDLDNLVSILWPNESERPTR